MHYPYLRYSPRGLPYRSYPQITKYMVVYESETMQGVKMNFIIPFDCSVVDLVKKFDLDCCKVYYDGCHLHDLREYPKEIAITRLDTLEKTVSRVAKYRERYPHLKVTYKVPGEENLHTKTA